MQWYTVRLCLRVKCFFSFCFKLGNTHHVMMRRKGRASVHLSLGASCQWEWRRQKGCRLSIDNLDNAKKRRSIQHHWGRNLSLQWSILTKSSQVRCGWQKLTCHLPYSCERYWGLHLDLHDTSQTSHRWTNGWCPSEIIASDGQWTTKHLKKIASLTMVNLKEWSKPWKTMKIPWKIMKTNQKSWKPKHQKAPSMTIIASVAMVTCVQKTSVLRRLKKKDHRHKKLTIVQVYLHQTEKMQTVRTK